MHAAIVQSARGPVFFWDVDAPVGLHGANKFDDVMFVQWCFYKSAEWTQIGPQLREVFRSTPINGACSGREGDKLITVIRALQSSEYARGGMVDGRVSPARGATYQHHGAKHTYTIFYLNAALRYLYPQHYPRIDLMPEFVWRIKDKATAPFF
jgi:hypothetical protein